MKLLERNMLGNVELKNRIIMSPMGTASDVDGGYSPQSRDYYVRRAQGGFGLIILACAIASDKYETRPNNMLNNFHQVARLADIVERCHNYGAKVAVQISPGCGRMGYSDPNTPPYAAGAVPSCWFPKLICKPFSVEQIADIVEKVGYSASLAKTAGADAVEFQGYGGYLIDQFMTDIWNGRADQYGGSLENRMRFPLELIREVKKTCGEDYPILFKFTACHEFQGGRKLDEGIAIAKILEHAGVTALHVDQGCYECYYYPITTVYNPDATKIHLTERIKQEVEIPVFCDGKLDNPAVAEQVLQEGKTDYIALAKQALADPDWPFKVKTGSAEDIRSCLYCNECHFGMHQGKFLMCAVNPQCGYERDYIIEPAEQAKRVLVIGGGPAGMQAALTAAARGHEVELWERNAELGGNLRAAAAPAFKYNVGKYLACQIAQVQKSGITLRLGYEATVEKILAWNADAVVLSTGADPIVPPIPGIEDGKGITAIQTLLGCMPVGKRAVVIGGGLVGLETALFLHDKGTEVTVVEMQDRILPRETLNPNNDQMLRKMLKERAIPMRVNTRAVRVTGEGIVLACGGEESTLPCDQVVLCAGFRANRSLRDALQDKIENLYVVGDCLAPRKVYTAVHEGFHAGRLI